MTKPHRPTSAVQSPWPVVILLLHLGMVNSPFATDAFSFAPHVIIAATTNPVKQRASRHQPRLHQPSTLLFSTSKTKNAGDDSIDPATTSDKDISTSRRGVVQRSLTFGSLVAASLVATPAPILSSASAKNFKSRTEGYAIQRTEKEWSDLLSPTQYFILRQGGTESPYSSILEGEERPGLYLCAGCGTPLFDAKEKFHSGTGWPSFASPVKSNVEMEEVSKVQYQLGGAEVRCQSCGGHLGDVFADGFLFPGTPAFVSGKRYCIDGAALVFVPRDQKKKGSGDDGGGELEMVRGDLPPENRGRSIVFPG